MKKKYMNIPSDKLETHKLNPFIKLQMFLTKKYKKATKKKFMYKCINCGKGHDGHVIHIEGAGYSNVGDFCSGKCFQYYTKKNGYSFRQRVTDKPDTCVVCNKEHHKRFFNLEKGLVTRDFCSIDCIKKAKEVLTPKIKKKYLAGLNQIINLFKSGKTEKDVGAKDGVIYFNSLNMDRNEFFKKK